MTLSGWLKNLIWQLWVAFWDWVFGHVVGYSDNSPLSEPVF